MIVTGPCSTDSLIGMHIMLVKTIKQQQRLLHGLGSMLGHMWEGVTVVPSLHCQRNIDPTAKLRKTYFGWWYAALRACTGA